jgi:hypothetical protein
VTNTGVQKKAGNQPCGVSIKTTPCALKTTPEGKRHKADSETLETVQLCVDMQRWIPTGGKIMVPHQLMDGKRWSRVGKLYLPPDGLYFGCRHCYELTYRSCQESHKGDRLYRFIASRIPGATPGQVKRALLRLRG